jgi:hypothetical protein
MPKCLIYCLKAQKRNIEAKIELFQPINYQTEKL